MVTFSIDRLPLHAFVSPSVYFQLPWGISDNHHNLVVLFTSQSNMAAVPFPRPISQAVTKADQASIDFAASYLCVFFPLSKPFFLPSVISSPVIKKRSMIISWVKDLLVSQRPFHVV